MKVFKFGGASVKDADGIRNLGRIIDSYDEDLVIVVSALGKTTNALEEVVNTKFEMNEGYAELLHKVLHYHKTVLKDLGLDNPRNFGFLNDSANEIMGFLKTVNDTNYDRTYDQVVSAGELWSTKIVAEWLLKNGINCCWSDIRHLLITDNRYRDANIKWYITEKNFRDRFSFSNTRIYVTQGFIGGTETGEVTTLGREGSDYTAAVIGNVLNAESVEIWKDVEGVLNADPKWMNDAKKLDSINYKEAVEMSFSGAKVIHPKTIKPLHNKNIPLIVRSFIDSSLPGTLISGDEDSAAYLPVFIRKENQILISVLPKDFSFVISDSLGDIFACFYKNGVKANMLQASAVSIAVCADNEPRKISCLVGELEKDYRVIYNDGVEMLTIRQYTEDAVKKICRGREMLVEQRTRKTIRFVVRSD